MIYKDLTKNDMNGGIICLPHIIHLHITIMVFKTKRIKTNQVIITNILI